MQNSRRLPNLSHRLLNTSYFFRGMTFLKFISERNIFFASLSSFIEGPADFQLHLKSVMLKARH